MCTIRYVVEMYCEKNKKHRAFSVHRVIITVMTAYDIVVSDTPSRVHTSSDLTPVNLSDQ